MSKTIPCLCLWNGALAITSEQKSSKTKNITTHQYFALGCFMATGCSHYCSKRKVIYARKPVASQTGSIWVDGAYVFLHDQIFFSSVGRTSGQSGRNHNTGLSQKTWCQNVQKLYFFKQYVWQDYCVFQCPAYPRDKKGRITLFTELQMKNTLKTPLCCCLVFHSAEEAI